MYEANAYTLNDKRTEPYLLDIVLNNVPVKMELDTGAAVSIISESTYQDIQKQSFASSLQPADSKLITYTGHHIEVLGTTPMIVRYETKELNLSIHVVKGSGPNLLGRDWLACLEVSVKNVNVVNPTPSLKGTVSLDNQPRCPRITIGSRGEVVVNYLIFAGIL